MRTYISLIAALGSFALMSTPSSVFASGCGYNDPCDMGVVVSQSQTQFDPLSIQIEQPYGHFRSVVFQRSPNVSITRIHGLGPTAGLADAPSSFTIGCPSHATQYCHGTMGAPLNMGYSAASVPAPIIAAPVTVAPVVTAPVAVASVAAPLTLPAPSIISAPATAPKVTSVRSHSGLSKFEPRQYGSMHDGFSAGSTRSVIAEPAQPYISPPLSVSGSGAPVRVSPTTNASPVAADGTYWEQVSGPTMFGDTLATKVICKRQLPKRIVNPVVGVPLSVPAQAGCVPARVAVPHGVTRAPIASGLAGGPTSSHAPVEDWSF